MSKTEKEVAPSRRFLGGMIIGLGVLGLGFSAELLRIHLTVVHDPFHPFVCHVNEAVDCNAVALSPQAVLLGVPVPIWAILTYLVFIVFGLLVWRGRQVPWTHAGDYSLVLAIWSALYSAYLAAVSAFILKTLCLYCAALYVVNLALLLPAGLASRPFSGWLGRRREDLEWLAGNSLAMVLVGVGGFGGVAVFSGLYIWSSQPEMVHLGPDVQIDISADPMRGNPRAPVTIIEFSDFECPACRTMHPVMDALLKKYPTSVRLIHKNFPLDSQCNPEVKGRFHPHACEAAAAAECAFRQGRYEPYAARLWEMKDLSPPSLLQTARDLDLDLDAFAKCLASPEVKRAILADVEDGKKIKIEGTPTFIINGYRFEGVQDLDWCSRRVEKLLRGEKLRASEMEEEPSSPPK